MRHEVIEALLEVPTLTVPERVALELEAWRIWETERDRKHQGSPSLGQSKSTRPSVMSTIR